MRIWTLSFAALAGALAWTARPAVAADATPAAKDGKAIFLENKCTQCHSIKSQGVEKKTGTDDADADADAQIKPPDLSGVGLERDAAWIQGYLLKQQEIKGHKHKKRFKGPEDELKTLAAWLGDLKTPSDDAKAKAKK